ncbi:hypothetical protein QF032_000049 [Streptomyces achromogenes]|nr:hypothetical protein [Streptomyces achromogenes]
MFSRCLTRAARRLPRSSVFARSAWSEALLTTGLASSAGWFGAGGVDLGEQVFVAVEEGAVDSGLPCDARDADGRAGASGGVDGLDNALAAAG